MSDDERIYLVQAARESGRSKYLIRKHAEEAGVKIRHGQILRSEIAKVVAVIDAARDGAGSRGFKADPNRPKVCTVCGERPARARGMCPTCYRRWSRSTPEAFNKLLGG